jgi:RNA-binding protein YhbY
MKKFDPKDYIKNLQIQVKKGLEKEITKEIKRKLPNASNLKVRVDLKAKKTIVDGLTDQQANELNKP